MDDGRCRTFVNCTLLSMFRFARIRSGAPAAIAPLRCPSRALARPEDRADPLPSSGGHRCCRAREGNEGGASHRRGYHACMHHVRAAATEAARLMPNTVPALLQAAGMLYWYRRTQGSPWATSRARNGATGTMADDSRGEQIEQRRRNRLREIRTSAMTHWTSGASSWLHRSSISANCQCSHLFSDEQNQPPPWQILANSDTSLSLNVACAGRARCLASVEPPETSAWQPTPESSEHGSAQTAEHGVVQASQSSSPATSEVAERLRQPFERAFYNAERELKKNGNQRQSHSARL
jgi:hypothetical protein